MEFKMVERSQRPEDGYRLACVEDVIKNAEMIRKKEIFTEQRTVRLLDGWVNRHLRPEVGFRKHMDYMLVARAGYTGRGDMLRKHLYYRISLSDEGREAALLLSCDDKNREVIYWLLAQIINHEVEPDRLRNSFHDTFQEKRRAGYLQVVDGLLGLAARVAKNDIIDWKTELHSARELQSVADQLISAELIFKGCYSAQKTHGKGKSPCVQSEKVEDDAANVDLRCLLKEALENRYTEMVYGLLELGSDLAPRLEIEWRTAFVSNQVLRMADRLREQSEWDETLCREFLETIRALPEALRQHTYPTEVHFGIWTRICSQQQRLNKYGKIKEFFERLKESYKNKDLYKAGNMDTLVEKLHEALRSEGFDNPTTIDTLGRANFAAGVAALFLSPHVKSPITVGILGNWGMGKSSMMLQIEKLMLQTASFPHLLPPESLPDGAEIVPNKNCKKLFKMICQEVKLEGDAQVASLASKLYRSKYHGILKSLASMDRSHMFRMYDHKKHSFSKCSRGHMNIMTVFYNAWHYRDEHEAWAGLAVEITKEIESTMTAAQWLSTCWRYASTRERESFYLQLILPSLIAIIVAVGVVVVAWILLSTSHNINNMLSGFIRYGSIPPTLVGIAWVVMKSAFSILKPVSSQMVGYMKFPDHGARLGYQQKVIDDINFLKDEIGREPKLFCSLIANTWFGLCQNNVPGTAIPKVRPASRENLRIVAFVDDLDRCQDTVILKVLSAINLVLAACQIDVVLGIDNKMIERAVQKEFTDTKDSDEIKEGLTENYMRKIIQIPLVLSDRSDLALELNWLPNRIPREEEDPPSDDDAPQETGGSHDAPQETGGSHVSAADSGECGVNIEGEDPATMTRHNTSLKIKMCGLVYSTIHYMNEKICGLMYKTISSCIQKKFACDRGPHCYSEALPWSGEELAGQKLKFTYSFQEGQAFMRLSELAKNYRRTPREFKEYENYHFVARNVLSKDPNVRLMQDWQPELIVWLFCCWQWRRQISIIIQNWDELVEATVSDVRKSKSRRSKYGPSLAEIVGYYIDQKLPSEQNFVNENVLLQIGSTISVEDRLRKVLEAAGYVQDRELKMQQVDWTNIKKLWKQQKQQEAWLRSIKGAREKEKEEQKAWQSLREALKEQDVSMECIQYFQGFRFHCNTGHLSWNPEWYQERL